MIVYTMKGDVVSIWHAQFLDQKCMNEHVVKKNVFFPHKVVAYYFIIIFVLCSNEYIERLEGKIRECLFF